MKRKRERGQRKKEGEKEERERGLLASSVGVHHHEIFRTAKTPCPDPGAVIPTPNGLLKL